MTEMKDGPIKLFNKLKARPDGGYDISLPHTVPLKALGERVIWTQVCFTLEEGVVAFVQPADGFELVWSSCKRQTKNLRVVVRDNTNKDREIEADTPWAALYFAKPVEQVFTEGD